MRSTRLQRLFVVALAFTASVGMAATQVYSVEPQELHEGWTSQGQNTYVGQSFVANVDSLLYIEWFVAELSAPGRYRFNVVEEAGNQFICRGYESVPARGWQWVRCSTFTEGGRGLTKGVEYVLRVSHSGGDSVNYVYRTDSPYTFGAISVGGGEAQPPPRASHDLACRVYGRMNPVGDVWRACVNHGNDPRPESGGNAALDSAESMGVKWLRDDFLCMGTWEDDTGAVMAIYRRYLGRGFNMVGILCYGSDDSTRSSGPAGAGSWGCYPPRNLYADVNSDTNWWAGYCRSIMGSLDAVEYWEVWPEANTPWFWHDPDIAYYHGNGGVNDTIDTPRERCSLYVRMCVIAESVADTLGGGRKIIGGATYRLLDGSGENSMSGVDWLWNVLDLAEHGYGGVENCFDILSVHPYMHYIDLRLDFIEDTFRINLDTARWVTRQAGCPGMELWATEYGWPRWFRKDTTDHLTGTLMQARNVSKFYISAIARQADPRGGYDRAIHYELTSRHVPWADNEGFGLLENLPSQPRLPHGWAFTQLGVTLTGKRYSGRVIDGDTSVDNHMRMYEFENVSGKRTWVCWKDDDTKRDVSVRLPVRTNSLAAESLAYSRTPPAFSPKVNDDGWLSMNLNSRPVFITEKSAPQRPDLRVDSVRFVQAGRVARAWVTNHGTRATPVRSGSWVPYPTWAVLRTNGDSLAQSVVTPSISPNGQAEFTFDLGRDQLADTVLISVTVNPNQVYVELGTDDNNGYALAVKP